MCTQPSPKSIGLFRREHFRSGWDYLQFNREDGNVPLTLIDILFTRHIQQLWTSILKNYKPSLRVAPELQSSNCSQSEDLWLISGCLLTKPDMQTKSGSNNRTETGAPGEAQLKCNKIRIPPSN